MRKDLLALGIACIILTGCTKTTIKQVETKSNESSTDNYILITQDENVGFEKWLENPSNNHNINLFEDTFVKTWIDFVNLAYSNSDTINVYKKNIVLAKDLVNSDSSLENLQDIGLALYEQYGKLNIDTMLIFEGLNSDGFPMLLFQSQVSEMNGNWEKSINTVIEFNNAMEYTRFQVFYK